jgi:TatD DNase family protein
MDAVSVACLSLSELRHEQTPKEFNVAGIHPWWIEDLTQEDISSLKVHIINLIGNGKLWALGESGIDRSCPETLSAQIDLFHWHMELSEKHGLPLIIHSVRAGADFLQILKERRPDRPWIFHDFRGNEQLLQDLLRLHPSCYFSFGMSIDNSPQIRELLPQVPLDHLFLETDDQKHLDIHDIYLRAAHHLGVDLDLLKSQTWNNFNKISKLDLH